jgi:hypothetical protein
MNKKIVSILLCGLMIASTMTTINIFHTVKGTDAPPESNGQNLLNTTYLWKWTNELANVTYDAYPPGEIPRGRSFGSLGGEFTKNLLWTEMDDGLHLEDVHPEQVNYINETKNGYSSIINVTDFKLEVQSHCPNIEYPYENPIPKNEMFAIQTNNYSYNSDNWSGNFTFDNDLIEPKDMTDLWPFAGTYNDYHFSISDYEFLSDHQSFFTGNVTYLTSDNSVPAPEDQRGNVYMLDDVSSSQAKLDNLTYAEAVIIVQSEEKSTQHVNASKCTFSVVNLSESSGDEVKDLLENYTMFVDNAGNDGDNLTFTYNLGIGPWPDSPFVFIDRIPNHLELWDYYYNSPGQHLLFKIIIDGLKLFGYDSNPNVDAYLSCVYQKSNKTKSLNKYHPNAECKGVILYDSNDCHYMISGPWFSFALPYFTVNNSVGSFLYQNHSIMTISGYINQTYLEETAEHCGGVGYNVMGNLTNPGNPETPIIVLSNRYDGMWGQTPGDSGVGGAILLGIAKYFKDYSIKPKYNIQFLFTTGEEYGFLGARHFNDSHNYTIKDWFILDQLAFDQSDTALCLHYNTSDTQMNKIFNAIVNESHYYNRTGYENLSQESNGLASEQGIPDNRVTDVSFCLNKDQDFRWDGWHRTGGNYTKGDCLANTDRNDINVSSELFWNITKYFCVDPNCWIQQAEAWPKDSLADNNLDYDTVQVNYTLDSCMPSDKVMVKAILSANSDYPFYSTFHRYSTTVNHTISRNGLSGSLNISLDKYAPKGTYTLNIYVYNSTGRIDRILYEEDHPLIKKYSWLPEKYTNDSESLGEFQMGPLNDIPEIPTIWSGPTGSLQVHIPYNFTVSTIDPNGDPVTYEWNWRSNKILPCFTRSGQYPSGVNYTQQHQWDFMGDYEVRVRARDIYSPTYSNWSQPFQVQDLAANFQIFTSPKTLANHVAGFQEANYGAIEPANFTWNLNGEGAGDSMTQLQYGCYVTYTYTTTGSKYQTLTVRDALGNEYTADHTTQVLYVISNFTANRTAAYPNSPIHFTNTSQACSGHSITNVTWDFGDQIHAYTTSPTHSYTNTGVYNVTLTVKHSTSETDTSWQHVYIDTTPPVIRDLTYSPYFLVSGTNITLYADIYENDSGINQVSVNITTPQNTTGNYTMIFSNETIYSYSYSFTNTWTPGIYNFTVWATDNAGNRNHTDMFWFEVSDSSPDNNTTGVSTSPILTVHVDDPNEEWANVSFYQYYPNSQGIDSENEWKAGTFTNTRSDGSGHLILANDTAPFGTGADGDHTVTFVTEVMTSDRNYHNLTINAGKTLNTGGHIVNVSGTLLNYGTITDSSTGGAGGSSGAGGGGQDFKQNSGGPKYAQAGSTGGTGSAGSSAGSGAGGHGGAGGGGGGGAWHNLSGNDADGGNGGAGGTGGKGGGSVKIRAYKINNQGVIHANGSVGSNGANGNPGGHKDFTYLGSHDISGGGGGGAGGGNGGNGGKVNITYGVMIYQGKIYASAGAKGNKGTGGSNQYNTYGVSVGGQGTGQSGGAGGGAGGGGAGGNGRYTAGYSGAGSNGNDGYAGSAGTLILTQNLHYVVTGAYIKILNAGSVVEWADPVITATILANENVTVTYGENTTESWHYYEDITLLPACRWLKIWMNLSTNNITLKPSVDKISLSTRTLLHTDTNVSDGTNATYQWTGRSLNTWYYWQVRLFNEVGSAYGPVWSFKTITS